jgi:hypothetical protein
MKCHGIPLAGTPRCAPPVSQLRYPEMLWYITRRAVGRGLIHEGRIHEGPHTCGCTRYTLRLYCITTPVLYNYVYTVSLRLLYHYAYCITTPTVSLRLYCITTSTIRIHEGRIHLGPIPYHYVYSAEYTAPAALYSIQRRVYRACCTARACTRPSLHRYIETQLRHVLQYQAPALRPPS